MRAGIPPSFRWLALLAALPTLLAATACQHSGAASRTRPIVWSEHLPSCVTGEECARLGDAAVAGGVTPTGLAAARAYHEQACKLGRRESCAKLGASLVKDAPFDEGRGAALLERACHLGHGPACSYAALLRSPGEELMNAGSAERDLLARGCDLGAASACTALGMIVGTATKDVPPDPAKALRLLERSCQLDDGLGCSRAAILLRDDPRAVAGGERALALLEKGCGLGDGLGCYHLARDLDSAKASSGDLAHAAAHYETACQVGFARACTALGYNLDLGRGQPVDAARANALYRRGCDLGDAASCHNLAINLVEGQGIAKDLAAANALYQKACGMSHGPACNSLAVSFEKARGVDRDLRKAAELYGRGCDLADALSCRNLGISVFWGRGHSKDPAKAISHWVRGCDLGDGPACREAGVAIGNGTGAKQDQGRAYALFERSCQLGAGSGCNSLGLAHGWGRGVPKNLERANALYEQACGLKNGDGCLNLGYSYEKGAGVAQDWGRAHALYDQGCGLGSGMACANLGRCLLHGWGAARDPERGAELLRKACDLTDAGGCLDLGLAYEGGTEIAQDRGRAHALFEQGCELGNGKACANLGRGLVDGQGAARDPARGAGFLRKACDLADAGGCLALGFVYEKGTGVAQDWGRAHALYEQGCKLGSGTACANLGRCLAYGWGTAKDPERGAGFLRKACDLADGGGCNDLGVAYVRGIGVTVDAVRSDALYEQACRLGNPTGCTNLVARMEQRPDGPGQTARALATLAREFPEALPAVKDELVFQIARAADRPSGRSPVRIDLLEALFHARWQPEYGGSALWADLVEDLLDRGLGDRAAEVLPRVTDPHELVSLRVDARARQLLAAHPELFDIDAAQAADLVRRQAKAEKAPGSLKALSSLLVALLAAPRPDEVLRLSDDALRRVKADAASFADADEALAWVMNDRARALARLERWQEAVEQLAEAARLPEDKKANVSQAINLAALQCRLDHPREALDLLPDPKLVTPYGRMQIERVRHMAAVELGDAVIAPIALSYLKDHRTDSQRAYQWALIVADQPDQAASVLVERLLDPTTRRDALLEIQEFVEPPRTPRSALWNQRWKAVLARPEVQAAVAKVGRIERFRIAGPRT